VSSHVIEDDEIRWILGWNQYNRSFFLSKHDKSLPSDKNPVFYVGTRPYEIATPNGLFTLALLTGLDIPHDMRGQLQRDEEDEQREYFVLHWPGEFVHGFRTDSMAQAEILRDELESIRSDDELQIRRVTMFKNES
jgi:hypothetical protein